MPSLRAFRSFADDVSERMLRIMLDWQDATNKTRAPVALREP
jgi:hypothetical protein